MKSTFVKNLILPGTLLMIGGVSGYMLGQKNANINILNESDIIKRADTVPHPVSFEPAPMWKPTEYFLVPGKKTNLDFEVFSIVERIKDDNRPYLKKATVFTNMAGYSPWIVYSDEGDPLKDNAQTAPNPLSYFTAGAGLCLMTQVSAAETALGIKLDDVKIEQRIRYTQDDLMTRDTIGRTESVETNILVKSDQPVEIIKEFKDLSLQSCFAGEALKNATPIATKLLINGHEVK